jgi:hypothetical protein
MDSVVVDKLKERYAHLDPLLVHRSVEKATSVGELFDILDTVPEQMPVVWNAESRRWETTDDLALVRNFK